MACPQGKFQPSLFYLFPRRRFLGHLFLMPFRGLGGEFVVQAGEFDVGRAQRLHFDRDRGADQEAQFDAGAGRRFAAPFAGRDGRQRFPGRAFVLVRDLGRADAGEGRGERR